MKSWEASYWWLRVTAFTASCGSTVLCSRQGLVVPCRDVRDKFRLVGNQTTGALGVGTDFGLIRLWPN